MPQTRAGLDAAKELKFRALLRHVHAHSPYYADIIRERELDVQTCGLGDFPLLTKSMLMANFDDIVTDRRVSKQVIAEFLSRSTDPKERLFDDLTVMHTSGTSGEVAAPVCKASRTAAASWPAVGKRSPGSLAMPLAITSSNAGGMPSTRLLARGAPEYRWA